MTDMNQILEITGWEESYPTDEDMKKYHLGVASGEEHQRMDDYLAENPGSLAHFEKMQEIVEPKRDALLREYR